MQAPHQFMDRGGVRECSLGQSRRGKEKMCENEKGKKKEPLFCDEDPNVSSRDAAITREGI